MSRGGRPQGSFRAYKTHKPVEAPTLRRDPSAPEKLQLLARWEQAARDEGCKGMSELPSLVKRSLEIKWHWQAKTIFKWAESKVALQEFVARRRLGLRGLRPFGSKKPLQDCSRCSGARVRPDAAGQPSPMRPLERVMARLHQWFNQEREYRHEVRGKILNTRLKYELEYERDRELVLEQHKSPEHLPYVLQACQEKLSFFQILRASKRQEKWMAKVVRPRIRATARVAQKLSEGRDAELCSVKGKLTWATSDRMIHLVARGTEAELEMFVSDPRRFIENRQATSVVVVDATALWLKLRGEERVYISETETTA